MSPGIKHKVMAAPDAPCNEPQEGRRSVVAQVCHRAKNDLQTAANLIGLAAGKAPSPQALVEAVEPRIIALSIPYNLVSETGDAPRLDALARAVLRRALTWGRALPAQDVVVQPVPLSLRMCSPLCLWLLEVLGNAVRHGIGGGGDRLRLTGGRDAGGLWLAVADNGPGLPRGVTEPRPGLGLRLASLVAASDLGGQMSFLALDPGLEVRLRVPEDELAGLNRDVWE